MTPLLAEPVWLFCPADRPERYARALDLAGVVIIDLEDAVAPADKSAARDALVAAAHELDPSRVLVRINSLSTPDGGADLAALDSTGLRTVMLPKVADAADVEALDGYDVVALCESAGGIQAAPEIAAASNCVAITWGGQDLAVDLGALATRDAQGRLLPVAVHARTTIRYAAAAAGIPAYDTVWIDIDDLAGVAVEARSAADQGFTGKMVIHPRHVAPVREAFLPTDAQVAAAERIVAAAAAAGDGVVAVDGKMIDRPVVQQAELTLLRQRRTTPSD
jgi:citrate lyase subunit beta/citryl-CoA lyase